MRTAVPVLKDLRDTYGLIYRVLINSEPNEKENGKIVAFTGSVGKLLPVVIVQGKSVHVAIISRESIRWGCCHVS